MVLCAVYGHQLNNLVKLSNNIITRIRLFLMFFKTWLSMSMLLFVKIIVCNLTNAKRYILCIILDVNMIGKRWSFKDIFNKLVILYVFWFLAWKHTHTHNVEKFWRVFCIYSKEIIFCHDIGLLVKFQNMPQSDI